MTELLREHGRVLMVTLERHGDALVSDTAAGATSLVVGDICDFDELGGSLYLNGVVLRYSTCDDDTDTITLIDPLPADADAGDVVSVWDTRLQAVVTEHVAHVAVDGDFEGDAIEAEIAHHLIDDLPVGMRGVDGESVLLEEDEEDDWRVIDVFGVGKRGLKFRNLDTFTLAADGPQDLLLTYTPVDGSEHVYWNGLQQRRTTDWTRVGKTVSILGDEALVDDVIDVEYAYIEPGYNPSAASLADPVYASGQDNPITAPGGVNEGALVLVAIMLPSSIAAASNLNGYALNGQTANVNDPSTGHTYRLALYSRFAPSGALPVPTFPADVNDTPWVMAAWDSAGAIDEIVLDTQSAATTAGISPAPSGDVAHLRVMATLSDNHDGIIGSPSQGAVVAEDNDNSEINIVLIADAPAGTVSATSDGPSYWCHATLTLAT